MASVERDSFGRQELHRFTVSGYPATLRTCEWCGGTNRRGELYEYHVETDGGRTFPVKGLFCSESCRKAYMGE